MAEQINSLEDLGAATGVVADAPVEVVMTPREPQRDDLGRAYATGKRKDAVARVWIRPGSGKVSGRPARSSTAFRWLCSYMIPACARR